MQDATAILREARGLGEISRRGRWHAVNDENYSQMRQAEFNAQIIMAAAPPWHSQC
jgi:hypothetical protein